MSFYLHDSYTLLLIYSTIYFIIFHFLDKNRIPILLEYGFNPKYSSLYHRHESLLFQFFSSFNTLIIMSILVSFYVFDINNNMSFLMFLKINLSLLCFFIVKTIVTYGVGILFEIPSYSKKYYHGYSSSLFLLAVIFFPIILCISYVKNGELLKLYSIYIFYAALILYFILKLVLLKRLNAFQIQLLFYNILYLCALEVLPYLALFKVLRSF